MSGLIRGLQFIDSQLRTDGYITEKISAAIQEIETLRRECNSWNNQCNELKEQLAEARVETNEMCKHILEYKQKLFDAQIEILKARKEAAIECLERYKCNKDYQIEEWIIKHFSLDSIKLCEHKSVVIQYTADGTRVEFCPKCGVNVVQNVVQPEDAVSITCCKHT